MSIRTLVAAALLLLIVSNARAFTIDVSAANSTGVTVSGFAATDLVHYSYFDNRASGGFAAWNAWSQTDCALPAGCPLGSTTGWLNFLTIRKIDDSTSTIVGSNFVYATPEASLAAASAGFVTGSTAYQFFINDDTYADNLGGLSLEIDVQPVPAPAVAWLLPAGFAALGWVGRRRRR